MPHRRKPLHLFNTLTHSQNAFIPTHHDDVTLYLCLPTDVLQLEHVRTYLFSDFLRRILRYYKGYRVRSVLTPRDFLGKPVQDKFFSLMRQLNAERPDFVAQVSDCPYVTNNVPAHMIREKYGYDIRNTYLFFNMNRYLRKYDHVFPHLKEQTPASAPADPEEASESDEDMDRFPPYFDLLLNLPRDPTEETGNSGSDGSDSEGVSGTSDYEEQAEASFDSEEEAEDPELLDRAPDFLLWQRKKQFKLGRVSPYTACAAMARFYFESSLDLYLGGPNLGYHEKEIALCRLYIDPEITSWPHVCLNTGTIQGESIEAWIEKRYSPFVIRYCFLKHPYGEPMVLNAETLDQAQASFNRLMERVRRLQQRLRILRQRDRREGRWYDESGSSMCVQELHTFQKRLDRCIRDNLNFSDALVYLTNYIKGLTSRLNVNMPFDWVLYNYKYILWLMYACFGLLENPHGP